MTGLYRNGCMLPWFRRERYDEARARMADADRLPASFDEWLEHAERREQQRIRAGLSVHRVNVDDDLFVRFCAERHEPLDGNARMRFAADHRIGMFNPNVAVHRGAKRTR